MSHKLIIGLILHYSTMFGINPNVAIAVAENESGFNPSMVGPKGEIGIFQIMPSTYPDIKKEKLFDPKLNIKLGIKYLAWTKKYCNHKEDDTYLVCYNYGIGNAQHVKHPKLFPYYKKIKKLMKKYEVVRSNILYDSGQTSKDETLAFR